MDLIFSILLIVFSIYCFILVGNESPAATPTELGAAFWPRIILALMIILLVVNTINVIKKMKSENGKIAIHIDFKGFIKSKLFVGMILVATMAIIMQYIGFIPSCFLFLSSYGYLLGEKRIPKLLLFSIVITFVLYIIFQGALDIMLARGVGVFRNFALMIEGLLPF